MGVQHELDAVLRGHVPLESASDAMRSWARLFIHQAAVELLDAPPAERDAMLARIPPGLQPPTRTEANRVWKWRRG